MGFRSIEVAWSYMSRTIFKLPSKDKIEMTSRLNFSFLLLCNVIRWESSTVISPAFYQTARDFSLRRRGFHFLLDEKRLSFISSSTTSDSTQIKFTSGRCFTTSRITFWFLLRLDVKVERSVEVSRQIQSKLRKKVTQRQRIRIRSVLMKTFRNSQRTEGHWFEQDSPNRLTSLIVSTEQRKNMINAVEELNRSKNTS